MLASEAASGLLAAAGAPAAMSERRLQYSIAWDAQAGSIKFPIAAYSSGFRTAAARIHVSLQSVIQLSNASVFAIASACIAAAPEGSGEKVCINVFCCPV
ncbi:hypothetical protein PPGU19_093880 (plasmid) [Paraburkholderia sp. PGU19]|nr:hypothetical protein PPGU19_093880 [Paraburkholderia sp. PGU19]